MAKIEGDGTLMFLEFSEYYKNLTDRCKSIQIRHLASKSIKQVVRINMSSSLFQYFLATHFFFLGGGLHFGMCLK